MAQLQWKPSEPGKSKGSSLEMNESLLKQVMLAVKESKADEGAVETEIKAFLKELGYEGHGAPSTVTYLINKKLRTMGIPIKSGYKNKGRTIKFFRCDWKKEPGYGEPAEDEKEGQ